MPVLTMTVNGRAVEMDIESHESLAHVLRERLGLIGTKIGCGEGECGACTVVLNGKAVLSCLTPAMKAHGQRVETVDGLKQGGQLHVLQQAFIDAVGAQCGYCTPGFLMSAKALLEHEPAPSRGAIVEAISGNVCRCTGYYQIVDAVELAVRRLAGEESAAPRVPEKWEGEI